MPVAERKGTIAAAVQRLNDAGVGIDDISMRRPTLDDVFLNLTGHAAESDEDLGEFVSDSEIKSPSEEDLR